MKPLSQSLEELAVRVKVLENSATATFEADRIKLEKRRHEIDDSIKTDVSEFDSAMREAAQAGRTWWNDTKTSMKRPLDEVRARVEKRQSEHELHRALRAADAAEEDAAAATEVAAYFLNVAEYAIIDAALARMAADDLVTEGAAIIDAALARMAADDLVTERAAIIDAALARMAADDLATEPAPTVGATS